MPLAESMAYALSDSEKNGDYHWAVGVVLAATASVISNLGLNFQKLTHIKISDLDEHAKKNYYKNGVWMAGLMMIILGSICDFAALAFGAQSIIAPLGSLTLVANVFFAPCLLGETLTRRDLIATFTIVLGATIAVAFASHKDTIYALDQLFGFYEQPRFGLYAIFILVLLGALWSAAQYMENVRRENPKAPQYYRLIKYHRFCYAALAGTIGAQSVLFAKCSAELIVNTFLGKGFFLSYYQAWMVLICMCVTIFLQIKWLNQGLQRFDALYIVPVFQSFWILISVIAGLVFFGEYAEMNSTQSAMFPIGILLTIAGVYFLSLRGVDEAAPRSPEATGMNGDTEDIIPVEVQSGLTVHSHEKSAEKSKDKTSTADTFDPRADTDLESVSDPLIRGHPAGATPSTPAAHTPQGQSAHHVDARKRHHQRIDSTVGFGGTGSPAGFLPTRAMTIGNSLRPDSSSRPEPIAEEDDDDDL